MAASIVGVRAHAPDDRFLLAGLFLFVLAVFCGTVAILPCRSLIHFPFSYSDLGPKLRTMRTGLPGKEQFPAHWLAQTGASWTVFEDGLQIEFRPIATGSVFVPVSSVIRSEVGRWTVDVFHDCPEVRSPIQMPKNVFESFWRHCLSHQFSGQSPFRATR